LAGFAPGATAGNGMFKITYIAITS
jgi:hypothetical protein